MVKKELIRQVMDAVGTDYGQRSIALHISTVFNQIVGQLFIQNSNQWNYYSKRITLNVSNRVTTVTLPLIQSSVNAHGVIRIMPTGADDDCLPDTTEFHPIPAYALNSSTDANNQSWMIGYTVTQSTIRFTKQLPKAVTSVLADVVPQFSALEDNDIINLPSGVSQMIIDGSIQAVKGDIAGKNIYINKSK